MNARNGSQYNGCNAAQNQARSDQHGYHCIGNCSLCGGKVCVPGMWMGTHPPEPTCLGCGAVKRPNGPIIDMVKR